MNNKKIEKAILDIVTYLLLSLGAVIMVTPFLWMIATSFKRPADQFTMTLIPNPATLDNYRSLSNGSEFSSDVREQYSDLDYS